MTVGLPDLANKNTKQTIFQCKYVPYMVYAYTKRWFIIYAKPFAYKAMCNVRRAFLQIFFPQEMS